MEQCGQCSQFKVRNLTSGICKDKRNYEENPIRVLHNGEVKVSLGKQNKVVQKSKRGCYYFKQKTKR